MQFTYEYPKFKHKSKSTNKLQKHGKISDNHKKLIQDSRKSNLSHTKLSKNNNYATNLSVIYGTNQYKVSPIKSSIKKLNQKYKQVDLTINQAFHIFDIQTSQQICNQNINTNNIISNYSQLFIYIIITKMMEIQQIKTNDFEIIITDSIQISDSDSFIKEGNVLTLQNMLFYLIACDYKNKQACELILVRNIGAYLYQKYAKKSISIFHNAKNSKQCQLLQFQRFSESVCQILHLSHTKYSVFKTNKFQTNFADLKKILIQCYKYQQFRSLIKKQSKEIKVKWIDQTGESIKQQRIIQNTCYKQRMFVKSSDIDFIIIFPKNRYCGEQSICCIGKNHSNINKFTQFIQKHYYKYQHKISNRQLNKNSIIINLMNRFQSQKKAHCQINPSKDKLPFLETKSNKTTIFGTQQILKKFTQQKQQNRFHNDKNIKLKKYSLNKKQDIIKQDRNILPWKNKRIYTQFSSQLQTIYEQKARMKKKKTVKSSKSASLKKL